MQEVAQGINFDLSVSEVDDSFLLQPRITFDSEIIPKLVRKSYIFYVIQLRTGVTPQILKNITAHIMDSCFEMIEQGLSGISFVINGTHHPLKNITAPNVRELLTTVMVISQNDDYFDTLQKTRHAVQTVAQRLHETKVSLFFFFSYVKIDHSLGTKKRSYIDYLNEHSDNCTEQVHKLAKAVRTYTDECKCFIVSLDKNGEEAEDYSQADTELMNQISLWVGGCGSAIYRNYSNNELTESFRAVTALLLSELYSLSIVLPTFPDKEYPKGERKYYLACCNFRDLSLSRDLFFHKDVLDLKRAMLGGAYISDANQLEEKLGVIECSGKVSFKELQPHEMIIARAQLYNEQLDTISWQLSQEIVSYKRKYELGKSYLLMTVNQTLLLALRAKIDNIYEISKTLYTEIFTSSNANKHKLFEFYNQLKTKIDFIQQVLLGIFKKRIGGSEIGKLSQLINLGSIKRALKVKLIRRINANPYLLDQVYRAVEDVVDGNTINFLDLEMNSQQIRYDLGNCILSDCNFVRAMQNYDAMGVAFELERPESAIADPGRIRIRQVSPHMMRTSQFFEKFIYKVNYTPEVVKVTLGRCLVCNKYNCYLVKHGLPAIRAIDKTEVLKYDTQIVKVDKINWNQDVSNNSYGEKLTHQERIVSDTTFEMREVGFLRDKGELYKSNYNERCDHTDRVGRTHTVLGFMPLFLTKEHWMVARHLMKPSLAWTATGEPLGYLFSQFQTIPFIVLANLIRTAREKQYELEEELKLAENCKNERELNELESRINLMRERLSRMKSIMRATEQTCKVILIELSTEKYDPKLLDVLSKQYNEYQQPINRTVDVISNNSAFMGQLYTAINSDLIPKPKEQEFHEFFIRLVEEELRRETDGWNEEETQDLFVDKLLNVEVREISQWTFSVVGGEEYLAKFEAALQGERAQRSFVELRRQELEMMLRKGGQFNELQRMLLIEYKRLYENRVLWLWYIRFLLYGPVERREIHKWKCLTLNNSYMLFTLIIQNKKQRKNHRRREAILAHEYADPFDYAQARQFLEQQFVELRAKRQSQVLKNYNLQVCVRAAEIFCMSGNLDQAAGTLLNFNQNSLTSYYNELARGKGVRMQDKLRMLLTGEHRGVPLFKGWKMSRARMELLRRRYPVEFVRYKYMF